VVCKAAAAQAQAQAAVRCGGGGGGGLLLLRRRLLLLRLTRRTRVWGVLAERGCELSAVRRAGGS
jgi:hypothetical protein